MPNSSSTRECKNDCAMAEGQKVDDEVRCINNIGGIYITILSMSRPQCSVWECSNRKGRCSEDGEGNKQCNCQELCVTDLP